MDNGQLKKVDSQIFKASSSHNQMSDLYTFLKKIFIRWQMNKNISDVHYIIRCLTSD